MASSGALSVRFRHELTGRLAAFELEIEPTQTGVLRFGSQAEQDGHKDGRCRPETFNFFLGHSRKGRFGVGHKTEEAQGAEPASAGRGARPCGSISSTLSAAPSLTQG
jgi:hypothetical protein